MDTIIVRIVVMAFIWATAFWLEALLHYGERWPVNYLTARYSRLFARLTAIVCCAGANSLPEAALTLTAGFVLFPVSAYVVGSLPLAFIKT